jgi:hypothetical protein
MDNARELIRLLMTGGPWVLLAIVIILLVQKPERAEKLKEIFFLPIFRLFKRGSRQYMAAKVSYTCTEFFNKTLRFLRASSPSLKIIIKWMNTDSDAILKEDGALVLCLRATNDQTRNILAATYVALPQVVCPTLRSHLAKENSTAVDLVLLRRLAEGLGKHARPVFQKYFFDPLVEKTSDIKSLFQQLYELDLSGTFVSIFLEELSLLGDTAFAAGDVSDKTEAFHGLLLYLLNEARREDGQEIPLNYSSVDFKLGIILLAKTEIMETRGVSPYLSRLEKDITEGCDSIYLIAYKHAFGLINKVIEAIEADQRISIEKKIDVITGLKAKHPEEPKRIILLRRNPMFSDAAFEDKVRLANITSGSLVEGTILVVSIDNALVDVMGVNGMIKKAECSWNTVFDCRSMLKEGEKKIFFVKSINSSRSILELSLRHPDEDPWRVEKIPTIGNTVEIEIRHYVGNGYLGYHGLLEFFLPIEEVTWTDQLDEELIASVKKAIIIDKNDSERKLICSLRRLSPNPWPDIQKRMPAGTALRGNVMDISDSGVKIVLPGGLVGFLPKEALERAGFEFADYQHTVVVGQGLDVVITHLYAKKGKIRLDLQRNIRT